MARFKMDEIAARDWLAEVLRQNANGEPDPDLFDLSPTWGPREGQHHTVRDLFAIAQMENIITCERDAVASFLHRTSDSSEGEMYWMGVEVRFDDGDGALMLSSDSYPYAYIVEAESSVLGVTAAVNVLGTLLVHANDALADLERFVVAENEEAAR